MASYIYQLRGFFPILFSILLLFQFSSCKSSDTADTAVEQVSLFVSLSEGASGNLSAGRYLYDKGSVIDYRFENKAGFGSVQVLINHKPAESNATLTLNQDTVIEVKNDPLTYFNGIWQLVVVWENNALDIPPFVSDGAGFESDGKFTLQLFPVFLDAPVMIKGQIDSEGNFSGTIDQIPLEKGRTAVVEMSGKMAGTTVFACTQKVTVYKASGGIEGISEGKTAATKTSEKR